MGRRPVVWLAVLGVLVPGLVAFAPAHPAAGRSIEPSVVRSAGTATVARIDPAQPRLLVRFGDAATEGERAAAVAAVGGTIDRVLEPLGVTRVAIRIPSDPASDEVGLTALRLSHQPGVLLVEPDSTGGVQFAPNDPFYLSDPSFGVGQWGIRMAHVDQAWDVARGSPSITVAVIDTGIDGNHPDLAGAVLPGARFLSSPDPTCAPLAPGSTLDDNAHGTHVAGIIAANGNNGVGIAGVAFGVKILPIKALDCTGSGLMSDVASGVVWATDHGARIINISLGSSTAQITLHDAIQYAVTRGVFVVAAAGNCGAGVSSRCASVNEPQYPGAFAEAFAVGATDTNDQHAAFSNIDPYLAISAPGTRIYSTTPTYPTTLSKSNPGTTSYAVFQGTSQASPFVAGVAALLLSRDPSLTVQQLGDRLRATSDDLGAAGTDWVYGAGRVNALRAITAGSTVRYGVTYGVTAVPKAATFSAPLVLPVTVTNLSSFVWSAGGTNPVRLAYHWADLVGRPVVWDGQRTALPADVPVGGTVTLNATIATPKTAGTYVLQLDLVREGIAWFSTSGAPAATVTVAITSGLAASYAPAASAQSTFVLGANAFTLTVSNTGTATWPAAGPNPVHLSYHWISPAGQIVVWEGARASLPADLAPGQSAVVTVSVASPPTTGAYTLRFDLVQEGLTWFSGQGVTPRDVAISVTNGFGASYGLSAPATSFLPGSRAVLPVTLTNTGLVTWSAAGPNPIHVAAHVYDLFDQVLVWDGERTALPNDVAPGQSVSVSVAVAIPNATAQTRFTYRVDLVQEGVAWFSGLGVPAAAGGLVAVIDYRASFAIASATISRATPSVSVTVTNTSSVPWTPGGTAPLDLGSHWLAADGTPLVWDGPRVALTTQPVAPGASVTLMLPLASPPLGASLVIDIVAEGLRWFGSGSPRGVTLVP